MTTTNGTQADEQGRFTVDLATARRAFPPAFLASLGYADGDVFVIEHPEQLTAVVDDICESIAEVAAIWQGYAGERMASIANAMQGTQQGIAEFADALGRMTELREDAQ